MWPRPFSLFVCFAAFLCLCWHGTQGQPRSSSPPPRLNGQNSPFRQPLCTSFNAAVNYHAKQANLNVKCLQFVIPIGGNIVGISNGKGYTRCWEGESKVCTKTVFHSAYLQPVPLYWVSVTSYLTSGITQFLFFSFCVPDSFSLHEGPLWLSDTLGHRSLTLDTYV